SSTTSPRQRVMMDGDEAREGLTYAVIGAAMEVHRELGPGLLESIYQECFECELKRHALSFEGQYRVPLTYKGTALDSELVIDLLFPGKLIVELKAVDSLLPIHEAQLLTYMRLINVPLGLLINF